VPQRVLILHNRYRDQGGEERAVAELAELLSRRAHPVEVLERSSQATSRARAAGGLLGGGVDPAAIAERVRSFDADIVHAHNLHPLFGWRALAAGAEAGARTVLHLHNFRLFCAIGIASRDGGPCFRCRGRDTRPGVRLRCRGSLGEALVYGAGLSLQQPKLVDRSDALIAVSQAHAERLFSLGLPPDKVQVLPNFAAAQRVAQSSHAGAGQYALASGRLVPEKGFDLAISAARATGVPLRIAGDGPDRERLERLARGTPAQLLGRVEEQEMARLRAGAGVVLVPSRSHDAFPYAALDALAEGVPVLACRYGGLPELVGEESVVAGDDEASWAAALGVLWADPAAREARGAAGLERVRERFSEERYYQRLMSIYAGADDR
jgi:glycosyltransferase involved in cell wall biosynthesis